MPGAEGEESKEESKTEVKEEESKGATFGSFAG